MDIFVALYAVVIAAGGVIGFVKAGSTTSLFVSIAFAGIVAYFEYKHNVQIVLASAVVLAVFMGYRSMNSGKFMPAGLVSLLSLLVVAYLLTKILRRSG